MIINIMLDEGEQFNDDFTLLSNKLMPFFPDLFSELETWYFKKPLIIEGKGRRTLMISINPYPMGLEEIKYKAIERLRDNEKTSN